MGSRASGMCHKKRPCMWCDSFWSPRNLTQILLILVVETAYADHSLKGQGRRNIFFANFRRTLLRRWLGRCGFPKVKTRAFPPGECVSVVTWCFQVTVHVVTHSRRCPLFSLGAAGVSGKSRFRTQEGWDSPSLVSKSVLVTQAQENTEAQGSENHIHPFPTCQHRKRDIRISVCQEWRWRFLQHMEWGGVAFPEVLRSQDCFLRALPLSVWALHYVPCRRRPTAQQRGVVLPWALRLPGCACWPWANHMKPSIKKKWCCLPLPLSWGCLKVKMLRSLKAFRSTNSCSLGINIKTVAIVFLITVSTSMYFIDGRPHAHTPVPLRSR